MPAAQFQTHVEAITASAVTVASNRRSLASLPKVGKRLRGTETFELAEALATGLVVLIPAKSERTDWYVAEVMPGGRLVRVLVRHAEGDWQVPGNLQMIGRASVARIADRASQESAIGSFIDYAVARARNLAQIADIRKRANVAKPVFRPCLELYDDWVAANPSESRLSRLTEILLGAGDETRKIIRSRSSARHADQERVFASVVNSLRRSAGTNYQGLVALGIAEELVVRGSAWYIHYPPPKDYMRELALRFTGSAGYQVDIDPDIDILIKNAGWREDSRAVGEPAVMLSVKTSLADRAGAAARWKMYFDVATRVCPYDGKMEGCAWHDQGLRFAKPDLHVRLQHCIVTANIYKIGSDKKFADAGELGTPQTKANTFMFDRRYATRVGDNIDMDGWEPLTGLTDLLDSLADEQGLPH